MPEKSNNSYVCSKHGETRFRLLSSGGKEVCLTDEDYIRWLEDTLCVVLHTTKDDRWKNGYRNHFYRGTKKVQKIIDSIQSLVDPIIFPVNGNRYMDMQILEKVADNFVSRYGSYDEKVGKFIKEHKKVYNALWREEHAICGSECCHSFYPFEQKSTGSTK